MLSVDARWREEEVLDHIQRQLPQLGAVEVKRVGSAIAFNVSWMTRGGPLFIVTAGEFTFDSQMNSDQRVWLHYSLSFRRAAVMCAILSYGWLGLAASLIEGEYTGGSFAGTLALCTFAYCVLFGFWYLVVPGWLEHRLQLPRFREAPSASAA